MNLTRLALRSITGNSFRSWVVGLCAMLVASLALATTLIVRGAENSLNLAIDRPGEQDKLDRSGEELTLERAGKSHAGCDNE
jgi:hypothetical protein